MDSNTHTKHTKSQSKIKQKLTPYQGTRKTFGYFRCSDCDKNWYSGNSWANIAQKCLKCDLFVYPFLQIKPEKSKKIKSNKEHPTELCQKCQLLGTSCVNLKKNKVKNCSNIKQINQSDKVKFSQILK